MTPKGAVGELTPTLLELLDELCEGDPDNIDQHDYSCLVERIRDGAARLRAEMTYNEHDRVVSTVLTRINGGPAPSPKPGGG